MPGPPARRKPPVPRPRQTTPVAMGTRRPPFSTAPSPPHPPHRITILLFLLGLQPDRFPRALQSLSPRPASPLKRFVPLRNLPDQTRRFPLLFSPRRRRLPCRQRLGPVVQNMQSRSRRAPRCLQP